MTDLTKKQLQFFSRVVNERPLNPILSNLHIEEGILQVSDGKITAIAISDDPQLEDLRILVDADKFINAYLLDRGELTIKCGKQLVMKRGSLTVKMTPVDEFNEYPAVTIEETGTEIVNGEQLVEAFTKLEPFVGEAGRTALWSCGIMLDGEFAYATNNTTLIRYDLPLPIDTPIIVPAYTVSVISKNSDLIPSNVDVFENRFVLGYGGAWLSSPLIEEQWPTSVQQMLAFELGDEHIMAESLHEDVKALSAFCDDSRTQAVRLTEHGLSTLEGTTSAEIINNDTRVGEGSYRASHILKALKHATHVNLFEKPAQFKGPDFVGVMIGLR